MNEKMALKRVNDLFILVRRMRPSMAKDNQGIKPIERRHIIERLREINKLLK